jgi:hypothetical protein
MMSHDHPLLSASPHESVYRDGTEALRQEVSRVRKRHIAAIEALRKPAEPVYVARCARAAAGRVLVGSAGLLVVVGLSIVLLDEYLDTGFWHHDALTAILLGSWPAAALAFVVARAVARRTFTSRMLAPMRTSGDVHADLERVRRFDPGQHALRVLVAMEPGSVAPMLAGACMLLPLTLHFFGGLLLGADIEDFDSWIGISMVVVGHCHLILAVRAWRYGRNLAMVPTSALFHRSYDPGWKTYGIVLAASLFPGVLLMFVPVFLVAVTGLFIPVMHGWAARRIARERDALAMTTFRALSAVTDRAG